MKRFDRDVAATDQLELMHRSPSSRPITSRIAPGCRFRVVTRGYLVLTDLLADIVRDVTGPAHLCISAWAIKPSDFREVARRPCLSLRWVCDDKEAGMRGPTEGWGDYIVSSKTHAKWVTIRTELLDVAIICSQNLQFDRRIELLEISEGAPLCDWLEDTVPNADHPAPQSLSLFDALLV